MLHFSIKQLFRQPGKALLFFLLMAASTALIVTGIVLTIENSRRMQIVESTYSTVGFVEQPAVSTENIPVPDACLGISFFTNTDYGEYLSPDVLIFPGADYVAEPEYRPYYIFHDPELTMTLPHHIDKHIIEFTPLEPVGSEGIPVEVEITKVIYSDVDPQSANAQAGVTNVDLHEGEHITVCQCLDATKYPLEVGEKYVAELMLWWHCPEHDKNEYVPYRRPYSSQSDRHGNIIDKGNFKGDIEWNINSPIYSEIAHVTSDNFYNQGQPGYRFIQWKEILSREKHNFTAVPTNALELLPCWHKGDISLREGREISKEEFESGESVCLISGELARKNGIAIGDKVNMAFLCSAYMDLTALDGVLPHSFSFLNADGELYEPFWEGEYEVVGTYDCNNQYSLEVGPDSFIIPSKSVTTSDDDNIARYYPMTTSNASFQIPNGTIQEFDKAIHEQVPEAARLNITYDDRGYTEIMKSLNNSRFRAVLLLLGGVMAALSIMALLLYFFVVKEKKRTAVERSLGMTKAQCRVSLLSALMILTVLSVSVGSVFGVLVLDKVNDPRTVAQTAEERDSMYDYDTRYSDWAADRELAEKAEIKVEIPTVVYFAAPLGLSLVVLVAAVLLMALSFHTDPIYLLSTRGKE